MHSVLVCKYLEQMFPPLPISPPPRHLQHEQGNAAHRVCTTNRPRPHGGIPHALAARPPNAPRSHLRVGVEQIDGDLWRMCGKFPFLPSLPFPSLPPSSPRAILPDSIMMTFTGFAGKAKAGWKDGGRKGQRGEEKGRKAK